MPDANDRQENDVTEQTEPEAAEQAENDHTAAHEEGEPEAEPVDDETKADQRANDRAERVARRMQAAIDRAQEREAPTWVTNASLDTEGKIRYQVAGKTLALLVSLPDKTITKTVREFLGISEIDDPANVPNRHVTRTDEAALLDRVAKQMNKAVTHYRQQGNRQAVGRLAYSARIADEQAVRLRHLQQVAAEQRRQEEQEQPA